MGGQLVPFAFSLLLEDPNYRSCKSENDKYQHLKPVVFDPRGVAKLQQGSALNVHLCPQFEEVQRLGFQFPFIEEHATMRGVKPNRKNIDISLAKCDKIAIYPTDAKQKQVEDYVFEYLEPELSQRYLGPDDKVYFKNESSPGSFYKRKGYKTKEDALNSPDFRERVRSSEHVPIFDYNGKQELLDIEEIVVENKIRGTFNPPLDFIAKQKYCFDKQNGAIAASNTKKWIKHGFVKQYAGFHRLAKQMEQFEINDEDDCSGYDRTVFMEPVYRLRWRGFQDKLTTGVTFWYCAFFAIYNFVLCPDGVIRMRQTGNGSGSNNTTTDNSIFHLLVVFRFIFTLWETFLDKWPTLEELLKYHCYNIYSDDAFGAHIISHLPGCTLEKFYEIKTAVYLEFGLVLKPKQHFISYVTDRIDPRHSFLGSYFYLDETSGFYLPYPRVEKISSSVKYTIGKANPEDVVIKVIALTILAAPVPRLYEECRVFLNFLARRYMDSSEIDDVIYQMAKDPNLSSKAWYSYILGRQARLVEEVGFENNNMERRVSRAERALEKFAKRTGMSEEGKQWLIAAIDPFHDKPLAVKGYPDGTPGKSFTQCHKLAMDIAKPANLSAGGTWDCLISTSNFLSCPVDEAVMGEMRSASNEWQLNANSATGRVPVGGLTVVKGVSGVDLSYRATNVSTSEASVLRVPNSVFEGKMRVLSQGFEVSNTTNELYKNGSVTVFELGEEIPEDKWTLQYVNNTAPTPPTAIQGSYSVLNTARNPISLATATQISGTQTWEAKDGAYVVCRPSSQLNPARRPQNLSPIVVMGDSGRPYPNSPDLTAIMETSGGGPYGISTSFAIPFHRKGIYFTNLSEQTTLHVAYNVWTERFPGISQQELLSLATESCDYDPVALEAYATIMSNMPVGVTFKENGFGDWFTGEVASLIDSLTGTKFASGIDAWQKEKFAGNTAIVQTPSQQRPPKPLPTPRKKPKPPPKPAALRGKVLVQKPKALPPIPTKK